MAIGLYFGCVILIFLTICVIKRKEIISYYGTCPYYFCWAFLLMSNLGFASNIQIPFRISAVVVSWLCIILNEKILKIKYKRNIGATLILLYLFVCLVSIVYSVSKFQTAFKCVELFTDLFILCLIYKEEEHNVFVNKVLKLTFSVFMALLVVTLVGFFVLPSFFASTGTSASKSLLGIRLANGILGANKSSALSALCLIWLILFEKKMSVSKGIMVVICIIVMLFAQSRSTLILVPIIILMRLFFGRKTNWFINIVVIIVGAFFVVNYMDVIFAYVLRGQTMDKFLSGTGRINVWGASLVYIDKNPILGYGFGAGGELVALELFGLATMHSGIFETLLGTGIMGLICITAQFGYVTLIIIRNTLKYGIKNNAADLVLLLYFLIRTVTSLGIGNWHSQEIMLWYCIMFAVSSKTSLQMMFSCDELEARGGQYERRYT